MKLYKELDMTSSFFYLWYNVFGDIDANEGN